MTERFPIWCRSLYLDMGFTLVEPGTSVGVKFGFRLKDWLPDSFIARQGNMVILPLLTARHPGTGTFSRLLAHLDRRGMGVAISSPTGRFQGYLERHGWRPLGGSAMGELWMREADIQGYREKLGQPP